MDQKLLELKQEALKNIEECSTLARLNDLRDEYLGKKGFLSGLSSKMGQLQPSERAEFGKKINDVKTAITTSLEDKKKVLEECIRREKDISKRMALLRESLKREEILDEFDREVFDCIVDRIIVGGYEEDGTPDPYKLTFVLKGNQQGAIPNSKQHYKEQKSKAERRVS